MSAVPRPTVLLLSAALLAAAPDAEAKRHGRHGWMHARFSAMRAWFRHSAHVPAAPRKTQADRAAERRREAARVQAAIEAERARRRRMEVAAFVAAHPPSTLQ